MARPHRPKLPRPLPALCLAAVVAAAGCGAPWTEVPVASVGESTRDLGAPYARFALKDGRVLELRVLEVRYPFVEGNRVVGKWSTERRLRVDLREVERIEVRETP